MESVVLLTFFKLNENQHDTQPDTLIPLVSL